ncbi:Gibberellin 20 oxidase 1-B [Beauveria bassiana D1-5]|uniref:Gibberellin 20 oxidase 1-B n=1 Tax=Beauveria bassiana D1-5 TaxID=1245745 RepID=A0A0A2VKK7_BEABA|nr:Gibberellin 20 oxidase 1-B [Beauveria bassiana D1-5]
MSIRISAPQPTPSTSARSTLGRQHFNKAKRPVDTMSSMEFAHLETISLSRLASRDPDTIALLYEAVVNEGVFYLEPYHGWEDQPALQAADSCFYMIFMPLANTGWTGECRASVVYSPVALLLIARRDRYKPVGRNAGKNSADGFEAFLLSRNSLCESPQTMQKLQYPEPIETRRLRVQLVMEALHLAGQIILGAISAALNLPPESDLCLRHRIGQQSTSTFGMLHYPKLSVNDAANAGRIAHTDEGTLTILFASDYGLQIQNPSTRRWEFVEPRTEHAVINVGDTLRFMSEKRLKACLHRVVPMPEKTILERYSLAYFMRPEYDAPFTDSVGRMRASIDWHVQKYFRSTGTVEYDLLNCTA